MSITSSNPVARIRAWDQGQGAGPHRITLFPTNLCNLRCRICWQRWADYDKSGKSELSDERLLELVDEGAALDVREWYFVGGGEPLARARVVIPMCEKIRARGMNGAIHTNGTLFKTEWLETLCRIGWRTVRVSLDGPTREINDDIRSGGFDKATANIRELTRIKREMGVEYPKISLYCTLTSTNFDGLEDFVRLAHELGCDDGVGISALIIEGEECKHYELTAEQQKELGEHIRRAMALAEELGVPHNFQDYLDEAELVARTMHMEMHSDHFIPSSAPGIEGAMCFEPWKSASILPDGRMGPCCAFFEEGVPSVKDRSLAEVWRGSYMTRVRTGMLDGNPPDYCKRCPSNLYLHKERDRAAFAAFLRENRSWESASAGKRAAIAATKVASSFRRHGVRKALQRGWEWVQLRRATVR